MKRFVAALLAIAPFIAYAAPARSCFCILSELPKAYTESHSVFLGETVDIAEPRSLDHDAPIAERAHIIKFKITRSWKGVPFAASEFSILWLTNCYECLPLPRLKEKYLVFTVPSLDDKTWGLVTTCNRTVGLSRDSNLTNNSIDPERDMKRLDAIARKQDRNVN